MKRLLVSGLSVLALVALASAAAAGEHEGHATSAAATTAPRLKEVGVDELAKLLAEGQADIFDANSAETRAKFGVVPGAKLLASSSAYDTAATLPADKTRLVVFYCANPRCTASDKAAERAREAGWSNVAVLRVGIAGWADAGKATATAPKA